MNLSYKDNPNEILDNLLKHHDIKTLRGILNRKARKKEPRGNDFFTIAVNVYLEKYKNDSKLEWAIAQIAEKANLSDKTVKNHITKFRTHMKVKIRELIKGSNYNIDQDIDISDFIQLYIQDVSQQIGYNGTCSDYKRVLDEHIWRRYDGIPF